MAKIKIKIQLRKTKQRGNGEGCLYLRGGTGNIRFAYTDAFGKSQDFSTGVKDKSIAEQIRKKLLNERQLIKHGIKTPASIKVSQHGQKPILEHVDDYIEWCINGKEDPEGKRGVSQKKIHIIQWIKHCNLKFLSEVSDQGLNDFLKFRQLNTKGRLSHKNTGARVWNLVRQHVIVFLNWCFKDGRLLEMPIRNVIRKNEEKDQRRPRRALTNDELVRLLKVAKKFKREVWWMMGLNAGLRKSDNQRLVWSNVKFLPSGIAELHIPIQKTKNRKDIIPCDKKLSALLKKRFLDQGSNLKGKVFPKTVMDRTRDKDLIRAGIEKFDSDGKVVDFHSCRMTLGTNLVSQGVTEGVLKSILRHQDHRTTLTYYNDSNSEISKKARSDAINKMIKSRR